MAELLKDRERLLEHRLGPVELAARLVDKPEVAVVASHALLVAELLIDRERFLVHFLGPVELAARPVDDPEVAGAHGNGLHVTVRLTERDDLPQSGLRLVELPGPFIEMTELIPSVSVRRIELDGAPIPAQRLLGVVQRGQGPEVPRRLGGFAIRGGSFGGLRLDDLREDGLGCLGLSLAQGREGFLDAGGILLLCQGLDRFGQRLDLVLVFLLPEVLALELLGQCLDGFGRRFGSGDRRLRLTVGLVPGIPDAERDEERRDPEAVAQQRLNDDTARPSIDGRQDLRA